MYMKSEKSKIGGSVSLLVGLWLVASSLFMGLGFMSNISLVGILVALFSLIELSNSESVSWVSWTNGILGAWLIISPAFLTMMSVSAIWNSVIAGIIVAGVALWVGMSSTSSIGRGHPKMS